MKHARLIAACGRQHNRISRAQLTELDYSRDAIQHLLDSGRLVAVEDGVYAMPPLLDDDWGSWMGATLTAPASFLTDASASAAWGFWNRPRDFEIVTRPGSGGPRRHGNVLVRYSRTLEGETTALRGIPITTPQRTLIDLAATLRDRALKAALRESIRLKTTTLEEIVDAVGRHRGRRGCARLARLAASYAGIPVARARSGAEVRAMVVLQQAGLPLPQLNRRIAGEEADLSWARHRLIVELDGQPFHLDVGEDARKQRAWERAGWRVERLSTDDVYERPHLLLELAPTT